MIKNLEMKNSHQSGTVLDLNFNTAEGRISDLQDPKKRLAQNIAKRARRENVCVRCIWWWEIRQVSLYCSSALSEIRGEIIS